MQQVASKGSSKAPVFNSPPIGKVQILQYRFCKERYQFFRLKAPTMTPHKALKCSFQIYKYIIYLLDRTSYNIISPQKFSTKMFCNIYSMNKYLICILLDVVFLPINFSEFHKVVGLTLLVKYCSMLICCSSPQLKTDVIPRAVMVIKVETLLLYFHRSIVFFLNSTQHRHREKLTLGRAIKSTTAKNSQWCSRQKNWGPHSPQSHTVTTTQWELPSQYRDKCQNRFFTKKTSLLIKTLYLVILHSTEYIHFLSAVRKISYLRPHSRINTSVIFEYCGSNHEGTIHSEPGGKSKKFGLATQDRLRTFQNEGSVTKHIYFSGSLVFSRQLTNSSFFPYSRQAQSLATEAVPCPHLLFK